MKISCYKFSVVVKYRIPVMVKSEWCCLTNLIPFARAKQCKDFTAYPGFICRLGPLQLVSDQDADASALRKNGVCEFKVNSTVVCGVGTLVQKF